MDEESVLSEAATGMQGAFESGTVLWLWYDAFLAVPALGLAGYMTFRTMLALPWAGRVPMALKGVSVVGTLLVLLVALDRVGLMEMAMNADSFGYVSLVGAVAAIGVGAYSVVWQRGGLSLRPGSKDAGEPVPEAPMEDIGLTGATQVLTRVARAGAWLVVRSGDEPGRIIDIAGDQLAIGRASDCEILIDHPSVSATHALIRVQHGQYQLHDLASSNGTWVNDGPVSGTLLRDGARISMGASELFFTQVGDSGSKDGGHGVLLVRSGPSVGKSFQVRNGDLVVGRQPGEGGARIDDPSVSQEHALLRPAAEGCMLYDLGSVNGTQVDDAPLVGAILKNGDVVKVGEAELQFIQQEAS